jgi:hypothetical protein
MSKFPSNDPDQSLADTLETLAVHKGTLKRIEDEYNDNQRISAQDLDWLFRITHANFNVIESAERLLHITKKINIEHELNLVLKDQEIYELRAENE